MILINNIFDHHKISLPFSPICSLMKLYLTTLPKIACFFALFKLFLLAFLLWLVIFLRWFLGIWYLEELVLIRGIECFTGGKNTEPDWLGGHLKRLHGKESVFHDGSLHRRNRDVVTIQKTKRTKELLSKRGMQCRQRGHIQGCLPGSLEGRSWVTVLCCKLKHCQSQGHLTNEDTLGKIVWV